MAVQPLISRARPHVAMAQGGGGRWEVERPSEREATIHVGTEHTAARRASKRQQPLWRSGVVEHDKVPPPEDERLFRLQRCMAALVAAGVHRESATIDNEDLDRHAAAVQRADEPRTAHIGGLSIETHPNPDGEGRWPKAGRA